MPSQPEQSSNSTGFSQRSSTDPEFDLRLRCRNPMQSDAPISSTIRQLLSNRLRTNQFLNFQLVRWFDESIGPYKLCFLTLSDGVCVYEGFIVKGEVALRFINREFRLGCCFQARNHQLRVINSIYGTARWVILSELSSTGLTMFANGLNQSPIQIPLMCV